MFIVFSEKVGALPQIPVSNLLKNSFSCLCFANLLPHVIYTQPEETTGKAEGGAEMEKEGEGEGEGAVGGQVDTAELSEQQKKSDEEHEKELKVSMNPIEWEVPSSYHRVVVE